MSNYGIRYIVIGVGTFAEKATDEDVAAILRNVDGKPFKAVALSDRVSDQLTVALWREKL